MVLLSSQLQIQMQSFGFTPNLSPTTVRELKQKQAIKAAVYFLKVVSNEPRVEESMRPLVCAPCTPGRVLSEDPIKRQSSTALFHYCYQLPTVGTSSEVMMGHVLSICPAADASIRMQHAAVRKRKRDVAEVTGTVVLGPGISHHFFTKGTTRRRLPS